MAYTEVTRRGGGRAQNGVWPTVPELPAPGSRGSRAPGSRAPGSRFRSLLGLLAGIVVVLDVFNVSNYGVLGLDNWNLRDLSRRDLCPWPDKMPWRPLLGSDVSVAILAQALLGARLEC